MTTFKKAIKQAAKIKMSLQGAAGSGKTYSALTLAFSLSPNNKVAVIDTENNSAALYSDKFPEFDVLNLSPPFTPENFISAIQAAEKAGYEALIIDSLSAEWAQEGGALDIQNKLGGRYQDWGKVTPRHDNMVQTILRSNMHIICCMRSKMNYAVETEGNKTKVMKLGLAPIQREGLEYEFTLCLALNQNNMAEAVKDRTGLFLGKNFIISADTGRIILDWLTGDTAIPLSITPLETPQLIEYELLVDQIKEGLQNISIEKLPAAMRPYAKEIAQTGLYHGASQSIETLKKIVQAINIAALASIDSDSNN